MIDAGGGAENALTDGALCTICYQAVKFIGHQVLPGALEFSFRIL